MSLLTSAVVLAASLSASAVSVSLNGSAPIDNIYKFQDRPEGGTYGYVTIARYGSVGGGLTSASMNAQGFSTAGAETALSLNAITFLIGGFDAGVQNKDFAINIYESASGATGGSPVDASLLSSQAGVLPASLSRPSYITFELDSAVILAKDKFYTIEFVFTEYTGAASSSLRFYTIGAGVTNDVGGRRWNGTVNSAGDISYSGQTSNGLVMYVDATPVIPEPATYSLLAAAAVVGYVIVRRRCKAVR